MKKIKVLTIVGTRPELIRLSRVISILNENLNHILVHTGQNYDYELNKIFFDDLKIKKPDYYLDVETDSLGKVLGNILIKIEDVLIKENPDAVLILGDTNSSISAIMAKRLHIPIYHMEAGNRSFDLNVPEEINRRIVDHIADFNLVYTEHSRRHLLAEGINHRRILLTGSPMFEVLEYFKPQIERSIALKKLNLKKNEFFTVSIHREENVDNEKCLNRILSILNKLCDKYEYPIIFSCHPRTKKKIIENSQTELNNKIMLLKPFGFFDYIKLQQNSFCVISDSGTISEESAILEFPAITLRNSMERPEALDSGSIILTGFNEVSIFNSIDVIVNQFDKKVNKIRKPPREYFVKDTSFRVLNLITGTAKISNLWSGISFKNDL